ncbi:hypothetical protein N018_20495 [Pseudomonas syringae CC1557]|uniref:Uncharacterized protein n=1 Tax=Pseudomonas syringae CC1557 TaxID=1357279 RepID=W0MYZ9_PSESX|nr:hypothetical protein N018_20495 [Pseudomonas syringae CC1557]
MSGDFAVRQTIETMEQAKDDSTTSQQQAPEPRDR